VTEGQNEYVLEINTLPGMTPTSLFPKIAAAAGYTFPELCATLADRAFARSQPAAEPAHAESAATDEELAVAV